MLTDIHVLGLDLKTFGILFALAFVACGVVVARRFKEWRVPVDYAYEVMFAVLVGGVVGARLYYVAEHWDATKSDPIGTIFSGAGLVFYGGLAGGIVFGLIWAKWRGLLTLRLADLAGVAIPVGYSFGRLGCQVAGDGDYGTPSDLPWAMAYPHGTVPTDVPRHPTPLYEALAMGLVAWALWRLRDRVRPGALMAAFLFLYGIERFLIEFIRRNADVAVGLTEAQLTSLGVLAIGAVWLIVLQLRGGIMLPAERRAPRPASDAAGPASSASAEVARG